MFFEENFNIKYFIINFAISLNILGVFCAIFDFFFHVYHQFLFQNERKYMKYIILYKTGKINMISTDYQNVHSIRNMQITTFNC